MKRIFCDCCGQEFDDKKMSDFAKGYEVVSEIFTKPGAPLHNLHKTVRFNAEVRISTYSLSDPIDICEDCRWNVIDRLDIRPQPNYETEMDAKLENFQANRTKLQEMCSKLASEIPIEYSRIEVIKEAIRATVKTLKSKPETPA